MSQQRRKPKARQRTGATAVEFAIAISVLLMVVFASIEFVRLNMLKHAVEYASYEAARDGIIIGAKVNDVKRTAEDHLAVLGVSNATVSVNPNNIKDDTQLIEVDITLPLSGNTWISPIYFTGSIQGKTRMLAERAAADMMAAVPQPPPPPPAPPADDD